MKYINNKKNTDEYKVKRYVIENKLTYHIDTMGCAMNENDSSKYRGMLEEMGFTKAVDENDANLILFNTCTIRENAENTLYGRLGALKNKRLNIPNTYIVVVGCMTQQEHVIEKINKSYSYTDIVLGTHSMAKFPEKLYKSILEKEKVREYIDGKEIVENVPVIFEDDYKASISIIYGCNNFCSFCIVPYVRGRERSRKLEDILNDAKLLASKGYKEITLLGQNVNSYGNDLENTSFAKLLVELEKIEGLEIIKFVSPHPKDFSDELIDVISKSKKIFKQIHLPLQAGSSRILKLMNRKYDKEQFLNLVEKIKSKCSDVTFSTDIIVGFPGETYEDFKETLDVVEKVKFDQIFMYIYSKRKGTRAYNMEDNISHKEKASWLQELKELFSKITYEINDTMLNKTYDILVDGLSKNNDKMYTGRTNTNKIVVFEAEEKDIGKIVKIKIIKNNLWYLTGEKLK